jgi:hypothetical protein
MAETPRGSVHESPVRGQRTRPPVPLARTILRRAVADGRVMIRSVKVMIALAGY